MQLQTFADVRADRGIRMATQTDGSSAMATIAADYINDATRRLLIRGDWVGTVVPIHLCVKKGCVVFPRYVDKVRRINICKNAIPIKGHWYEFLQYQSRMCNSGFGWYGWLGPEAHMSMSGWTPCYSDIWADGRLVRVFAQYQQDIGKTVTIFGVDNNDQPLRRQNPDLSWSEGWVITIASPYGTTANYVRRIDRVAKEVTQGNVWCYAYDPVANLMEDLAVWEPSETNPTYPRYRLSLPACCTGTECDTAKSAVALVKLKYVPVVTDTDLVLIDNIGALKLMIQAIRAEESGDRTSARGFEMDAIRELNLELADEVPDDQIPVESAPFTGATMIGRQRCF